MKQLLIDAMIKQAMRKNPDTAEPDCQCESCNTLKHDVYEITNGDEGFLVCRECIGKLKDGIVFCHDCERLIMKSCLKDSTICPHCDLELFVNTSKEFSVSCEDCGKTELVYYAIGSDESFHLCADCLPNFYNSVNA